MTRPCADCAHFHQEDKGTIGGIGPVVEEWCKLGENPDDCYPCAFFLSLDPSPRWQD